MGGRVPQVRRPPRGGESRGWLGLVKFVRLYLSDSLFALSESRLPSCPLLELLLHRVPSSLYPSTLEEVVPRLPHLQPTERPAQGPWAQVLQRGYVLVVLLYTERPRDARRKDSRFRQPYVSLSADPSPLRVSLCVCVHAYVCVSVCACVPL